MNLLILKTNDPKTIQYGLRILRKDMSRKHRSEYIVMIESIESIESFDENWLKSIFKSFWDKQILDVVIMYPANEIINIFAYTPFMEKSENSTVNDVHIQNVSALAANEHFPPKLHN